MLRIYTCSKEKDKEVSPKDARIMLSDSDTSSDFEPTDHRPIKTSRKQRQSVSNQPRRYHPSRIGTDHPVHHIERSSDSDPAPNDSVQEKNEETRESRPPRLAPPEMITTEVMSSPSLDDAGSNRCQSRSRHASQEDCLFPASNQDADELFAGESDSALALAIHASMEDFEVQVGPISGYYGDDQDDTLPWNPHHLNSLQHSTLNDDAASPRGSEKEVHYVKFRRVNIVQDVLNVFMDPKVMEVQLIMEFINEKALDGEGVSREVYSAFWELFLQQCEGKMSECPDCGQIIRRRNGKLLVEYG
ncbi:hypothetical protein F7725_009386 [Dissostichus mawsoni]|uniref:Uncharacterized protein n=1 Tax=Dissostichus mawsoni TaxID=36200 RepID=A0A7J5ZA01_DISMA|nr:hypothetical protein F7725_009386 [Dissostichus mawsoni]